MTKDNSTGKPKDFYNRGQQMFDRLNLPDDDDDDTQGYVSELARLQCKWPTCQTEEYQQALAEQIKQELYTGRPWVGLTVEEIGNIYNDTPTAKVGQFVMRLARAIEAKLKEKNT